MTSFCLQNFGCRVNQAEAFAWSEEFQRRGLHLESDARRSDLVVVNTCTLTARADREVKRFIRKVARENPSARLVVTGCLVDRAREELAALPGVWRFVPNTDKTDLPRLLLGDPPREGVAREARIQPFRSRAMVKVQDGCDFRCAFCVIPGVRGRSASLPPEEVLARLRRLSEQDFREAVLTGIHLCSYGRDLEPRSSLAGLLDAAERSALPLRLRLSSLDPRFLEAPLVEALTLSRSICPHFHLSLQHGSERLLRLMGRRGGADAYSRLLDELRRRSPEAALGADIIVGFPGETESDFEQTREFVERSPLTYVHVFSYSARPGTPAASLPQVDPRVKKRRTAELRLLSARKTSEFRRLFIGRVLEGLIVERSRGALRLLTPNYLSLTAPYDGRPLAGTARVRVTEAAGDGLLGLLAVQP